MKNLENLPEEIEQWQHQAEAGQITYQELANRIEQAKVDLDQALANGELSDEKYQTLTNSLTLTDLEGMTWTIFGPNAWRRPTGSGEWVEGAPKLDEPQESRNLWPVVAAVLGLLLVLVLGGGGWLLLWESGPESIAAQSTPAETVDLVVTDEPALLATAPTSEPIDPSPTGTTIEPAVSTQEPTDESGSDSPPGEPTEEASVQATEEPAAEPTEATIQPTPTEEPPVQPPEEQTVEPAPETTSQPVPTAEPLPPPATGPPKSSPAVEPTAAPAGVIAYPVFDPVQKTYNLYLRRWPEGEVVARIDQASQPAIHTPGQTLLYRSWGDQLGLIEYDVAAQRPLSFINIVEAIHPNWSPTGDDYVYMANNAPDQKWHIYINNSDGLVPVDGEFSEAAFLDRNRLVFRGCGPPGCGLYTAGREGGDLRQLTNSGSREHRNPAPSPDGSRIAFMSNANDNWDIYLISAAATPDTVPQRLTTSPAPEGLPAWSPDGRWLAYVSNEAGRWFMNVVPADGSGDSQQLFELEGPVDGFVPAGSPGQQGWLHEQIAWFE